MQAITAEKLETLIAASQEEAFLIVDVRQAEEYRLNHIPGAVNIPLARVEFDPLVSDNRRKVIFYCRGNSRSKVAAVLAAGAGLNPENIFHLTDGMAAYTGEILLDVPRMDHFPAAMPPAQVMEKAINFEKGAFLFYDRAKDRVKGTCLYKIMETMAQAEVVHAKTLFKMLDKQEPSDLSFDDFFNRCTGDILEGGAPIGEINIFLDTIFPENRIKLLEFAIELEFCAYDLYKNMAETAGEKVVKEMFFVLAQAEKKHLSKMIESLDCSD
ncbi:MAG: hypothetical protein KKF12_01230 [Proteobacteria bacterium]|nr:hypothetical protein [Desulfobacula sp.]MBU3951896.1 hypothetical protein [Pseudomonadota bacterium]MBU4129421.1 hypothetical protein [Pseudomonadota bacterium]